MIVSDISDGELKFSVVVFGSRPKRVFQVLQIAYYLCLKLSLTLFVCNISHETLDTFYQNLQEIIIKCTSTTD